MPILTVEFYSLHIMFIIVWGHQLAVTAQL